VQKAKNTLLTSMIAMLSVCASHAEKQYDPGASDTSIKIGNTMPYSGPNSAFAIIGRAEAAYFKMVNDQGGINGRKIEYISYDDGYSPPKTVEQVRKLIEGDEVLLLYSLLGTPTNRAVIKYVNAKKVPHLLIASGGTVFGDYKQFPWSMGFQPDTQGETRAYGRYVAENYPNAKIGVLYSGDGFGRDNITGFKQGLGDTAANIVAEQTYEATDPTIDSQLAKLRSSGVEVFADFTTPKFAAMAIRKTAEMGWKPVHILQGISLSIEHNSNIAYAYMSAQAMEHILRRCGDDLTRANVLKQAESLGNLELVLLLPGIKVRTSPTGHYPIRQTRMQRFDGIRWQGFGPLLQLE
jgi:branched-chain amino acid transport system substrate-binding protein